MYVTGSLRIQSRRAEMVSQVRQGGSCQMQTCFSRKALFRCARDDIPEKVQRMERIPQGVGGCYGCMCYMLNDGGLRRHFYNFVFAMPVYPRLSGDGRG